MPPIPPFRGTFSTTIDPTTCDWKSLPGTVLTVVDKLLQRHLLMSPDFKQPLAMCMIMRLAVKEDRERI